MVRGLYTGSAGMIAQMHKMDTVANNLANVSKTGYKRDTTIFKSFPEMLIRRTNDDGVVRMPLGSYDTMPMAGKLGTGVEVNEVFTRFSQGSLKQTHNNFDVALNGKGFLTVMTEDGPRYTRNGSFLINSESYLVTKDGHKVVGEKGFIQIKKYNFKIDKQGRILVNSDKQDNPRDLTNPDQNDWKNPIVLDRFKIVNFARTRHLDKQGNSFFKETKYSGKATVMTNNRPKVNQGFLESSNVNPVEEMVRMIEVQRSYEASQKAVKSSDETLARLIPEII